MARMEFNELLAREICWQEFSDPKHAGCGSKASYWLRVSENKKTEYRRDAAFLRAILPRLPRQMVDRVLNDT